MKNQYMAIDQYGNTYHGLQYPRKELMQRLGVNHAVNMYVDTKSGDTKHIGYVIGKLWLTVYQVLPFKG